MSDHYRNLEQYPGRIDACGAIARMLDGLGFRFYWATCGLEEEDYRFCPEHGVNSLGTILRHIWGLLNWIHASFHGEELTRPDTMLGHREHVLDMTRDLRDHILGVGDEGLPEVRIERLPFWHIINGPISDAISHVGQINVYRRLLGKAPTHANVFTGKAPPAA